MLAYIVQETKHKQNKHELTRQDSLPSCSSLSVHLATLSIQSTDFLNKCGTRKKNIGRFLYGAPVQILVINHPPSQVFVQNLHDFAV